MAFCNLWICLLCGLGTDLLPQFVIMICYVNTPIHVAPGHYRVGLVIYMMNFAGAKNRRVGSKKHGFKKQNGTNKFFRQKLMWYS